MGLQADLSVGSVFSNGWKAFKANQTPAILTGVLLMASVSVRLLSILMKFSDTDSLHTIGTITNVGGIILYAFIYTGLLWNSLAAARGGTFTANQLLTSRRFLQLAVTWVVMGVCAALGIFLLIVPGVILALRWSAAPYFVIERSMSWRDALAASWAATRGRVGDLFVLSCVYTGVALAGVLACGLGLLVSVPLVSFMKATVYDRLTADPGAIA